MYIVVTGAAGFIGSNVVKALGERGEHEVLAVDDLKAGDKFANLVDCDIAASKAEAPAGNIKKSTAKIASSESMNFLAARAGFEFLVF